MSAGSTIMGAIGSQRSAEANYQAQRAQTKLANQQAMTDWAYRKQLQDREWANTLKIYEARVKQHKLQVVENNEALYRAYYDGQVQLNNYIEKTRQANFDSVRRLAGIQGQAAARGQQGRRAGMVDKYNAMSIGIEQSRRLEDVTKMSQRYVDIATDMRRKTANANRNSWNSVSIAPQPTVPIPQPNLAPQTAVAPSSLGMWSAIGGALGEAGMGIAGHLSNANQSVPVPGSAPTKVNSVLDGAYNIGRSY